MSVPAIATSADATANSWTWTGSGSNWWAEKRTGQQGKLCVAAATSAALWGAIQSVEYGQESFGTHGPKSTSFNGHI